MNLFNYLMSKNGHNTSVRDDLLAYLLGSKGASSKKTATGTTISISDATKEKIIKLTLDKESSQETTTGKNLIRYPYVSSSGTYGGVNIKLNENGSLLLNGTGTGSGYFNFSANAYPQLLKAGTYTLSLQNPGVEFAIAGMTSSDLIANLSRTQTSKTFTLAEDKQVRMYIVVRNGVNYDNLLVEPMLEIGSIATSWEKPTNGASPNPDYPQEIITVKDDINLVISDNINENSYTINLGDNEIVGKDDYLDKLVIDKSGNCYLYKIFNKIDSYNGETITTDYWSTTGGLDTGATIYYVLDEPIKIDLEQQLNISLFIGNNVITNNKEMNMTLIYK